MRITVNGEPRELAGTTTVAELIIALGCGTRGTAIVLDGAVVPRAAWPTESVPHGATVELITAVQGG